MTSTIERLLHEMCPQGSYERGDLLYVAEQCGVTNERVRQVAVGMGLRTTQYECALCGSPVVGKAVYCKDCKEFVDGLPNARCSYCGRPFRKSASSRSFCSQECLALRVAEVSSQSRHRSHSTKTCLYCGKEFEGLEAQKFCCHSCAASYRWKMLGYRKVAPS
jgi:hypothetical protein